MFVTFTNENGSLTEQLDLGDNMDLSELKGLLEAIMGIPSTQQIFVKNGQELDTSGTLKTIGIRENDLILVVETKERTISSPAAAAAATTTTAATATTPVSSSRRPNPTVGVRQTLGATYWDGMSVHDVLEQNQNPSHIVQIIQAHEHLQRELNFHNPKLAAILKKDEKTATKELSKFLIMNSAFSTVNKLKVNQNEQQMRDRLNRNNGDEEAKKFFQEKERKAMIDEQYMQVMSEYPESLTRVLMLYINVTINNVPVQAFVDSGAQTSVMSAACARRVGIDNLIDERFAGSVVGVGSGKTLGRIHLAPLNIENNFFPMSLTVLDDDKGLGDKNMEFLLGLDMLKRHTCTIDLEKGVLKFRGVNGRMVDTPFLHEKDLPETKGGTKGFDPNKVPVDPEESNQKK